VGYVNDFRLKLFLEQRQKFFFPDARAHPLRVAVGASSSLRAGFFF